jgi:hypothetical protein
VPGKTLRGRVARIKMLGNMVVPQHAQPLFEEIMAAEAAKQNG